MTRNLKITRTASRVGSNLKWGIKLDGKIVGQIKNGESFVTQIDEQPHTLEIIQLSLFGTPTIGVESGVCVIMAGNQDCFAVTRISVELFKNKIHLECTYNGTVPPVSDFVDAVAKFVVNVFKGDAIIERLNDSNNRRKDLEIFCGKDGVHIRWQEVKPTHLSLGYGEEIVPYEAAGVTLPKEQLTQEILTQLENAVKNAILTQTRFVKNEYGCFVLGNKKSSLY